MSAEQPISEHRKISVVMVSARADVGGGPIHILRLMDGLKAFSNIQLAVAIPAHQELSGELSREANHLIEMPVRSFSLGALRNLIRYLNANDVTIVHSHGFGAGIYSRIAKLFTHSNVVHTYHGFKKPSSTRDWVKFAVEWLLSRKTDVAICVSTSESDEAKSLHLRPRSQVVIHHAIAETFFAEQLRERKDSSQVSIGTICRIDDAHKNLSALISALARLPKNYELLIAGTGPDREKLISQAQSQDLADRCHFIGHVESSAEFLNKLDIFVSASRHEGMPAAVLEAVALDLRCALSDIPPHREIGSDLRIPLFQPDNVDALVEILKNSDLIPQPRRSERFPDFQRKFSLGHMVSRTAELYGELANQSFAQSGNRSR